MTPRPSSPPRSASRPDAARPSDSQSSPPPEHTLGANRPRTVLEVLCRELGTSHPDAALRQIRTMKRMLRKRHKAERKLRRLGIPDAAAAADTIVDLQGQMRVLKAEHKAEAEQRIEAIDAMAETIEALRQRLQSQSHPQTPGSAAPDVSPAGTEAPPASAETTRQEVDELNTLLERLRHAVDEIRLELWCYQQEDETLSSYPDDGRMAHDLLDRIEARTTSVSNKYEALYEAYQRTK